MKPDNAKTDIVLEVGKTLEDAIVYDISDDSFDEAFTDVTSAAVKPNEAAISAETDKKTKSEIIQAKKKRTTPDYPTVSCKTCGDYNKYMKGTPDDNASIKHNPPPIDGITLRMLGDKSDGELLGIINKLSIVPRKSDVRIMYANGYACSWGELTVIAQFRGFNVDNPGEQCPHYSKPGIEAVESSDESAYTIYISHGKRETEEKKFTLSVTTVAKVDELVGDKLSKMEKSKVVDAIFSTALDEWLSYKKSGIFSVKYRASEEVTLI